MGEQVNFFMAKEDEAQFLDFLKETGKVVVFPETSYSREFPALNSLPEVSWPPSWRQIMFCLLNHDVSSRLVIRHSEDWNKFFIDTNQSSVIEYLRCFTNGKLMYYGRIWAEDEPWDSEQRVFWSKEPAFQKWYEEIASWLKRHYEPFTMPGAGSWLRYYIKHVTVPDPGFRSVVYLSPNMVKFRDEGGMLGLTPPIRGKERESVLDREGRRQSILLADLDASVCTDWPTND